MPINAPFSLLSRQRLRKLDDFSCLLPVDPLLTFLLEEVRALEMQPPTSASDMPRFSECRVIREDLSQIPPELALATQWGPLCRTVSPPLYASGLFSNKVLSARYTSTLAYRLDPEVSVRTRPKPVGALSSFDFFFFLSVSPGFWTTHLCDPDRAPQVVHLHRIVHLL